MVYLQIDHGVRAYTYVGNIKNTWRNVMNGVLCFFKKAAGNNHWLLTLGKMI